MLKKFAYKGNIGSDGFILYMRSELHDLFIPANQTKEPMSTDDKQWQYLQWDPKWTNISDLFTLRYPNMVSWEIPELNGVLFKWDHHL